jgi:hypothetical protein
MYRTDAKVTEEPKMDDAKENGKADETSTTWSRTLRGLIAVIIAVLVVGYTAAVLAGAVAPNRQLSATGIVLLALAGGAIAVIVHPEALQAISSLSAGGVRVDLKEVQNVQMELAKRQEGQLQLLQEIFPLLLPDNVLKHLQNLEASERGREVPLYNGGDSVREELRRLRYMHLIEVAPPHKGIGDVPNGKFALPEYVRLTQQGAHWIERAQELANMRKG